MKNFLYLFSVEIGVPISRGARCEVRGYEGTRCEIRGLLMVIYSQKCANGGLRTFANLFSWLACDFFHNFASTKRVMNIGLIS